MFKILSEDHNSDDDDDDDDDDNDDDDVSIQRITNRVEKM